MCSLSIEAQAEKHAAIKEVLNKRKFTLTHEKFQLRFLPPLKAVPDHELLDFLTDHAKSCPQALREELTECLIRTTGGMFEPLANYLEEAENSEDWYGLLYRLRNTQDGITHDSNESF